MQTEGLKQTMVFFISRFMVLLTLFGLMSAAVEADSRPLMGQSLYHLTWNEEYVRLAKDNCAGAELTHDECRMLKKLLGQPRAYWMVGEDPKREILELRVIMRFAGITHEVPTIVIYRIPDRDCGGYARNKERFTPEEYREWILEVAAVLHEYSDVPANIILEPDALPDVVTARDEACAGRDKQEVLTERLDLIRFAIWNFTRSNSRIFVDAGNTGWLRSSDAQAAIATALVDLLQNAQFQGIAVNIANFYSLKESVEYGEAIGRLVYADTEETLTLAIDSSRSGGTVTEADGWCNPPGAALDPILPTLRHSNPLVELVMIIKTPGQSDGSGRDCRGGPEAGEFSFKHLKDYLHHSARIHLH